MITHMKSSLQDFGADLKTNAANYAATIRDIFSGIDNPTAGRSGVGGGAGPTPALPILSQLNAADKQAKAFATQINGYFNGINSAFNGMIRGMLSGTETLQQAFRKMVRGLFMDFVTAMERMVEQWLRRRRGFRA
jgi:hypothetical protein